MKYIGSGLWALAAALIYYTNSTYNLKSDDMMSFLVIAVLIILFGRNDDRRG